MAAAPDYEPVPLRIGYAAVPRGDYSIAMVRKRIYAGVGRTNAFQLCIRQFFPLRRWPQCSRRQEIDPYDHRAPYKVLLTGILLVVVRQSASGDLRV